MKMQRGASERRVYKREAHTQATSNDAASSFPMGIYATFAPAEAKRILDKLEIHYTPKHDSWLNMAEIELSHFSRQCLDRRIPDQETMRRETEAWYKARNSKQMKVEWRFTTEDARIKLKKLYPVQIEICQI